MIKYSKREGIIESGSVAEEKKGKNVVKQKEVRSVGETKETTTGEHVPTYLNT